MAIQHCKEQEKRLIKAHADNYQEQFTDMITRGTLKRMNEEDFLYDGPIHYIQHFEVMKESSKSTKMRIVFNASSTVNIAICQDVSVYGSMMVYCRLHIEKQKSKYEQLRKTFGKTLNAA